MNPKKHNKKQERRAVKMNYLGYYAMDKKGNLYQFHCGEDDKFYIIKPKSMKRKIANINNYDILHIGVESDSMFPDILYTSESCQ